MTFQPRPELDPVEDYDELVAHIASQTGLSEDIVRQYLGPVAKDLAADGARFTPEQLRANVEILTADSDNNRKGS